MPALTPGMAAPNAFDKAESGLIDFNSALTDPIRPVCPESHALVRYAGDFFRGDAESVPDSNGQLALDSLQGRDRAFELAAGVYATQVPDPYGHVRGDALSLPGVDPNLLTSAALGASCTDGASIPAESQLAPVSASMPAGNGSEVKPAGVWA